MSERYVWGKYDIKNTFRLNKLTAGNYSYSANNPESGIVGKTSGTYEIKLVNETPKIMIGSNASYVSTADGGSTSMVGEGNSAYYFPASGYNYSSDIFLSINVGYAWEVLRKGNAITVNVIKDGDPSAGTPTGSLYVNTPMKKPTTNGKAAKKNDADE